jgi:hypothetical protein
LGDKNEGKKAGLTHPAPAQAEGAGFLRDRDKPRIGGDEPREARLQIGVAMEEVRHALSL